MSWPGTDFELDIQNELDRYKARAPSHPRHRRRCDVDDDARSPSTTTRTGAGADERP